MNQHVPLPTPLAATGSAKKSFSFGTLVLLGLAASLVLGFIAREAGDSAAGAVLRETLRLVGQIFVQLLKVLVPPPVLTGIIASIAALRDLARFETPPSAVPGPRELGPNPSIELNVRRSFCTHAYGGYRTNFASMSASGALAVGQIKPDQTSAFGYRRLPAHSHDMGVSSSSAQGVLPVAHCQPRFDASP